MHWDRDQFIKLITTIPPVTAQISLEGDTSSNCFKDIDYFIRFESLNKDFKKVCELIGIPWTPLPIRNKSNKQHYTSYYDDELVEIVRNKHNEEIKYFDYEFVRNS